MSETLQASQILKVDAALGLVFGFAIVCKEEGEKHFDLQGDHIPENVMLQSAADFMKNSRVAKDMHQGDPMGNILFAFPLTSDIAKSLDIQTNRTGLLIAMQPDDPEILRKFADGTYTGFSIGGTAVNEPIQ